MKDIKTKKGNIIYINHIGEYGFIRGEDDKKLFFHETGVISPNFKKIKAGIEVEYLESDSPKGLTAIGVVGKK